MTSPLMTPALGTMAPLAEFFTTPERGLNEPGSGVGVGVGVDVGVGVGVRVGVGVAPSVRVGVGVGVAIAITVVVNLSLQPGGKPSWSGYVVYV